MFRRLTIIAALVVVLAGVAVFAQGRQPQLGRRAFAGRLALRDRILDRLQQRLNLSETQMNGARALAENRRKEMDSLRQNLQQKRQSLRQTMQQSNPNPTDVGNATLALKGTREEARAINQRFLSGFRALLTPDQVATLPKRFAQ